MGPITVSVRTGTGGGLKELNCGPHPVWCLATGHQNVHIMVANDRVDTEHTVPWTKGTEQSEIIKSITLLLDDGGQTHMEQHSQRKGKMEGEGRSLNFYFSRPLNPAIRQMYRIGRVVGHQPLSSTSNATPRAAVFLRRGLRPTIRNDTGQQMEKGANDTRNGYKMKWYLCRLSACDTEP